ncbi:hypothetical protein [Williamsia sp. CHRR-6]|uniref:hypothetical protein n=1 Tax=Williamsia sp. CHRR-6 TaxID=2835871 RepID=UPI001BDA5234|nr:hypothetical protein [Williamsia sp. CHRR-6]MBT0567904.1 hypothetical protein [Williamsia sp. CHRR-6]
MLTALALVPGAPLLVPELSGPGADDTVGVREAVLEVGRRLARSADQWIAIGVGDVDRRADRSMTTPAADCVTVDRPVGSFAGFGVDVVVSLTPDSQLEPDRAMPTSMLIAAWLRGQVAASATVIGHTVRADLDPSAAQRIGSDIVAGLSGSWGVLVVADGSFGLTEKAPGGLIEGAVDEQGRIDAAVATADVATLAALDPVRCAQMGVGGRAALQVAAAMWSARGAHASDPNAESLYCAAPFGVGYQVAWWGT